METETNDAWYWSSFVTFYNITQGLVNTICQLLINWPLWRGYFGRLERHILVAIAIVERWLL